MDQRYPLGGDEVAIYEREFSKYPEEKIKLHHFKNVDDSIIDVINQINALRKQGLQNQAQRIIENNKDTLGQYIFDATTIRTLFEEIWNTQTYAKAKQQYTYFEDGEPDAPQTEDIWLGGDLAVL